MNYIGHIKNGLVVLDTPTSLPEGTEVEIIPRAPNASVAPGEKRIPSLYERLKPIIGIAEGLPSDLADKHDHYIPGKSSRNH